MRSEPVAPGGNAPYQALNWPSWAFAASPANLADQIPANATNTLPKALLRQSCWPLGAEEA